MVFKPWSPAAPSNPEWGSPTRACLPPASLARLTIVRGSGGYSVYCGPACVHLHMHQHRQGSRMQHPHSHHCPRQNLSLHSPWILSTFTFTNASFNPYIHQRQRPPQAWRWELLRQALQAMAARSDCRRIDAHLAESAKTHYEDVARLSVAAVRRSAYDSLASHRCDIMLTSVTQG